MVGTSGGCKSTGKTMNVENLFIGAWVSPTSGGVVHPAMEVTLIDSDTVYCRIDPEQGDPFEYSLEEICPLSLSVSVIKANSFVESAKGSWVRQQGDFKVEICASKAFGGFRVTVYYRSKWEIAYRDVITSVHEFQRVCGRFFKDFVLVWAI